MRLRLLALAFAGLTVATAGCRSHLHAGGGQGLDAGAAVGPARRYYNPPPPVVERIPPPDVPLPETLPSR